MLNKQPEALRLADLLGEKWYRWKDDPTDELKAAAELRRLHAENEDIRATCDYLIRENAEQIGEIVALEEQRDELLEALKAMLEVHGVTQEYADKHIEIPQSWVEVSNLSRAAIAKAEGDTK